MARDIHGLLVLFVMPSAFILIMSLALRDLFLPSAAGGLRWQAWDGDATAESAAFLARLPAPGGARTASKAEVERALAEGKIQAALRIEPGFARGLAEENKARALAVVEAEPGTPAALVAVFRMEAERALALGRVTALLKELGEGSAGGPDQDAEALAKGARLEFRYRGEAALGGLTAVQQSVPAWLVFAMFFVVIPISTIFIAEKQQGTLPRLRSLRVSPGLLLAGKVAPFYAINIVQTALMLAVGRWVVPLLGGDALRLNVDWLALGAVASATSLAAIGFALAVAAVARTNEQATTIGGVANILFGALGGVMVPKLMMPPAMQPATWASPMAWGLEGFLAVFLKGAGVGDILPSLGLLLGFAALCLGVAWWRLRE